MYTLTYEFKLDGSLNKTVILTVLISIYGFLPYISSRIKNTINDWQIVLLYTHI